VGMKFKKGDIVSWKVGKVKYWGIVVEDLGDEYKVRVICHDDVDALCVHTSKHWRPQCVRGVKMMKDRIPEEALIKWLKRG